MTIIKLDATPSTNTYLSALWRQGIFQPPVAVYTVDQTAGRGRRGEVWQSESGKNLTISFLIPNPTTQFSHSFAVIVQVSLLIHQWLEQLQVPNLKIKWPNDIMAGSKKICGILVERALLGASASPFVVGVGINLNQQHFKALDHVTSVVNETGKHLDIDEMARSLSALVENGFSDALELDTKEYSRLIQRFESRLYQMGERCCVAIQDNSFQNVTILGVNEDGRLRVRDPLGEVLFLDSAETHFDYAAKC